MTYSTREETLTALLNKNNIIYKKHKLKICEATPKKTQLFVGGLKSEVNNEMLMKKFSEFGDVHGNIHIHLKGGVGGSETNFLDQKGQARLDCLMTTRVGAFDRKLLGEDFCNLS